MYEHLPKVSKENYEAFTKEEYKKIVKEVGEYRVALSESNKYLAEAIEGCAKSVAEDFTGDTKVKVRVDTIIAQLMVLRLIDKELGGS